MQLILTHDEQLIAEYNPMPKSGVTTPVRLPGFDIESNGLAALDERYLGRFVRERADSRSLTLQCRNAILFIQVSHRDKLGPGRSELPRLADVHLPSHPDFQVFGRISP